VEMCVALIGVMLLLFGSLKFFLWLNTSYVVRERNYEQTRAAAASDLTPGKRWVEPRPLDVFGERKR